MGKTRLKNADIFKVDLVPAGAQQLSSISIMKSKEANTMAKAKLKKGIPADIAEKLEQAVAMISQIVDSYEDDENEDNEEPEVTKEDDEETEPEVTKEDNGEVDDMGGVAKGSPALLKKMKDMEDSNRAMQQRIAKMEDDRLTREYVGKAAGLSSIPGATTEELAVIMKEFSAFCPDKADKLEAVLKSANEAIAKGGVFAEYGTSQEDAGLSSEDAYKKLETMASERVTKSLSSKGNAFVDAMRTPEGRRLYAIYKNGR